MADLPASRVLPSRAFESSAVDFAGPFNVKLYPVRRLQHIKVYLCLFICMTTKAIHLEVVTDLTADAFLASLTRFISRRGLVRNLHSDNATNFVGAARQLRKTIEIILQSHPVNTWLLEKEITFHFIPPRSPHFGGLWERAVQSAKYHLRRVIGEQVLTLEEFTTLTCRVEAMLNSRPITPLSSDPCELEALTPGHFLTFGPPALLPETDQTSTPMNRLKRWQLVQSVAQNIWKRWQRDYLYTLQNRPKWTTPQKHISPGDLVILQEDNLPPLQWKMGRVISLFPGKDNVPRVAEVKTASGVFKRPDDLRWTKGPLRILHSTLQAADHAAEKKGSVTRETQPGHSAEGKYAQLPQQNNPAQQMERTTSDMSSSSSGSGLSCPTPVVSQLGQKTTETQPGHSAEGNSPLNGTGSPSALMDTSHAQSSLDD
ncbi:uncharacterized protein LOC128984443 [Macrosteles quadrilineatus]|uniref:uncharacterized protein LOC128984443 n=1 Tax=Macrosteles quadrilineatus TaxID=74068 RepID=UPI0023E1F671|nr:uncharacterized protein LOC128984443 [Macrosteles quadrilineatus]